METIEQQEALDRQIREGKKEFRSDGYSLSIGEIVNMYRDGDLIVNPNFQRIFRWSLRQKTRLIESILMDIPMPSIFVYQNEAGRWEVVDGVQRISTILEFMGYLRDENEEFLPSVNLEKTRKIPALENLKWKDIPIEPHQLDFKRYRLEVKIIKNTSDKHAKFEVFQRLNTGGSLLSGQELRNSMLIMANINFYDWLIELAESIDFKNTINLTDRWIEEKYHQELVLRVFTFDSYEFKKGKIDDFIDDAVLYGNDDSILSKVEQGTFDLEIEKAKFFKTFYLLNQIKGEHVFQKIGRGQQFLESYFAIISVGLYHNIDLYDIDNVEDINNLTQKINTIYEQTGFEDAVRVGASQHTKVRNQVSFGKEYFKK